MSMIQKNIAKHRYIADVLYLIVWKLIITIPYLTSQPTSKITFEVPESYKKWQSLITMSDDYLKMNILSANT